MTERRFLFLQGPHGPFFTRLAERLSDLGHHVERVGFNQGDRLFWSRRLPYRAFAGSADAWARCVEQALQSKSDLVLYGDTRPFHAEAIRTAKLLGVRVHVFEEGYLRPHWVTYERDGSNGHSKLMTISRAKIDAVLGEDATELRAAGAGWGALRQHIFYGAVYHFVVLALNQRYPNYRSHRRLSVADEFLLYLRLMASLAPRRMARAIAEWRLARRGRPYHLVLLQLAHDASFQAHGPYATMREFLETVFAGFSTGGLPGHDLVFKTHPLEDGREPLARDIVSLARAYGLTERVHILHGGKLARLLDEASSVVTVNSTAAQQALWRGLPVKAVGQAVYCKPGFVSEQSLSDFFAAPQKPDLAGYRRFRMYLTRSSQVIGSYYSAAGRRQLLRRVPAMVLDAADPYQDVVGDGSVRGKIASTQRLKLVET